MPSSFSKSTDSQNPFAKIRASIAANNASSQAKASQPSRQLLSYAPAAALDTLNDDQALALLLKNETVARLVQNSFVTRVEEYQQKLERSYNQRLLELEEYTRSWRDSTKELWLAVNKGDFNPNKDHQEALSWEGPQLAGRGFNPERPITPQEIVEKELDSNGRVVCISVKNPNISAKDPGTFHSDPPFAGMVPNSTHREPSQGSTTDINGSAANSTSIKIPSPKGGAAPQIPQPQNGESEQSGQDSTAMRGLFSTGKTQHNAGLEQEKSTSVPDSLPAAQPSLFQRTLDLSKGLKELEDDARRDGYNPQAHSQWLAIGGEPRDVRSPSPKGQQERIADIPSQAHGMEEEVLPPGPNNQDIHDSPSKGSEKSDLVVLDERPKNVTFRCDRKRPFPAANEKVQTAKRPKTSRVAPSTVSDRPLPQRYQRGQPPGAPNLPLDSIVPPSRPEEEHLGQPAASPAVSQAGTEQMKPLGKSNSKQRVLRSETMARRTKELEELQEQLRQLGGRIEADYDQANKSDVGGKIETSGQLQADGSFGRSPASSEVTARQQLRDNLRRIGCRFQEDIDKTKEGNAGGGVAKVEQLQKSIEQSEPMIEDQRQIATTPADLRPAAHLPPLGVPSQTNVSSGDSNSLSTAQKRVTDPPKTLTDQSQTTPVKGEGMSK